MTVLVLFTSTKYYVGGHGRATSEIVWVHATLGIKAESVLSVHDLQCLVL